MLYLLDTNVFIQAQNISYPMDIFPGFWDLLEENLRNGNLYSIDWVSDEMIRDNEDELSDWVKEIKTSDCFLDTSDEETQRAFTEIVNFVDSCSQYKPPAKNEFFSVADSWLIAKAICINATIVTHEEYRPEIKRRVPIPNICKKYNIPYIKTVDMLRTIGKTFHYK